MDANPVYAAVLTLMREGIVAIPCCPGSKVPTGAWTEFRDRRPTEKELKHWFTYSPKNNIAVVTGNISGNLCVLDLDDGIPAAVKWMNEHPITKETRRVVTQKGVHVWFRVDTPPNFEMTNDGIEIKFGGLCMVPPSVHPSGKVYRWAGEHPILRIKSLEDIGVHKAATPPETRTKRKNVYAATGSLSVMEDNKQDNNAHADAIFSFSSGYLGRSPAYANVHPLVRDPIQRRELIKQITNRVLVSSLLENTVDFIQSDLGARWYIGFCPFHDDEHRSLAYDSSTNRCKCFSVGCTLHNQWNDPLDMYKCMYGVDTYQAVTDLGRMIGIL